MYVSLSSKLKRLAFMVGDTYSGDSPFINIPIYQQRIEPEEDSSELVDGPPSMYRTLDKSDNVGDMEDIARQGERPGPIDILNKDTKPVVETNLGMPFENNQGESWNDTTTPEGLNEDKETIGFDPGTLTVDPFD
jgi:hypothetical protein